MACRCVCLGKHSNIFYQPIVKRRKMLNAIQKLSVLLTEFNSITVTLSFDEKTKDFVVVVKSKDCRSIVFTDKSLEDAINQL